MPAFSIQTDLSNAPINQVIGSLSLGSSFGFGGGRPDADVVQNIDHYYREQTQIQTLQFPFDRPKFYFFMAFSKYDRADMFTLNATLNTQKTVILPLPQQIDDIHAVNYSQDQSLGPLIGAGADSAFRSINTSTNSLTDLQSSQKELTRENAKELGGAVGAEGLNVLDRVGVPASTLLGTVLGVTPNQFFTVLLTGPQYKRLQFSWHLVPRSYEESRMIMDIVRFLNNSMAPGLTLGGALFSFPLVVRCAFVPNFPYLFRFKPAVIENMSVSYAPLGQPAFYHGIDPDGRHSPPESVRISMTLLEMEYWLKSDFKDETAGADDTRGDARGVDDPVAGLGDKAMKWFQNHGTTPSELFREWLPNTSAPVGGNGGGGGTAI